MKPTPTPVPSMYEKVIYPEWGICCPATPTPHVLGSRTFADGRITQELMSDGTFVTIMREPNFQTPTPIPTINFGYQKGAIQVYSTDDTITYLTTEPSHLVDCPKPKPQTSWAVLAMIGCLLLMQVGNLLIMSTIRRRLERLEKKGGEGSDPNS